MTSYRNIQTSVSSYFHILGHFLFPYAINSFLFPAALLPRGKAEAVPARPGHAHSEDLPWLEVSHRVPAAKEESDSSGSVVPPIRRKETLSHMYLNKKTNSGGLVFDDLLSLPFSFSQQQKKYQNIKSATTVVQSYIRGWQVCAPLAVNSL